MLRPPALPHGHALLTGHHLETTRPMCHAETPLRTLARGPSAGAALAAAPVAAAHGRHGTGAPALHPPAPGLAPLPPAAKATLQSPPAALPGGPRVRAEPPEALHPAAAPRPAAIPAAAATSAHGPKRSSPRTFHPRQSPSQDMPSMSCQDLTPHTDLQRPASRSVVSLKQSTALSFCASH